MNNIFDEIWKSRHPYDALFLELIEGYTIKESDEFPNIIFYIKNNILVFYYFKISNITFINKNLIWNVFESKFNINYEQTYKIINNMLSFHLKIETSILYTSTNNFEYTNLQSLKNI